MKIKKGFLLATQQSGWHSNGYTTTKSVSTKEGVARTEQKSTIAIDTSDTQKRLATAMDLNFPSLVLSMSMMDYIKIDSAGQ